MAVRDIWTTILTLTGITLRPDWGYYILKLPPVPLLDAAVVQKTMLRVNSVVYGTLQFNEQEMPAKEAEEEMEEMMSMGTLDLHPYNK